MSKRSPDEITNLYNDNAEWYAKARVPGKIPERKYLDWFVRSLSSGNKILDIGCGVGKPIAEHLIQQGFAVKGVDGAEQMIVRAKTNLPQGRWEVADMRTLHLGEKFHGVLAWDSFFHLNHEEQRAMFPIFQEHILPGGILIFTSGPDHGEAIGEMCGRELYHSSLSSDEYRKLLKASGFEVLDHQVNDPECGGHTVWVAKFS